MSTYDHRNSEYALQSAVAYAVHHHALGRDNMLVHGKRAGKHPDIALIFEDGSLNLVELKLTIKSEKDALSILAQIASYVSGYEQHSVAKLATWYCHARVESLCGLSFRGGDGKRFEERDGKMFHLVEEFDRKQVSKYRDASTDLETAYAELQRDFEARFGRPLQASPEAKLKVSGVTLIAELWGDPATNKISELVESGFDHAECSPSVSQVLAAVKVDTRRASPSTWLTPASANG